jgi:hypothetical protein
MLVDGKKAPFSEVISWMATHLMRDHSTHQDSSACRIHNSARVVYSALAVIFYIAVNLNGVTTGRNFPRPYERVEKDGRIKNNLLPIAWWAIVAVHSQKVNHTLVLVATAIVAAIEREITIRHRSSRLTENESPEEIKKTTSKATAGSPSSS